MRLSQIIKFGSTVQSAVVQADEEGERFDDQTLESDPMEQRGDTVALSEVSYSSSYDMSSPVAARGDMLVW